MQQLVREMIVHHTTVREGRPSVQERKAVVDAGGSFYYCSRTDTTGYSIRRLKEAVSVAREAL